MKPVLIILNGSISQELFHLDFSDYSDIACADGAIDKIDSSFSFSKKVFGDLDSIIEKKKDVQYITLEDQDYTDFEKILTYYSKKNHTQFHVIGGSGLEQDHFLGHLSIAKKFIDSIEILFFDTHHEYFVTQSNIELNHCLGKMISIIPLPYVHGLTYEGLKYPLTNETLEFGNRIGTRNIAIEETVKITFNKGCIALFKEI